MNFGLELNVNVGLEQRLAPQMIQSLKLLQMNSMELEMMVKQELEANPLLELSESEEAKEDESESQEKEEAEKSEESSAESKDLDDDKLEETDYGELRAQEKNEEIDWESYLEEGFDVGNRVTEETENPDEKFEKVPVYETNLQDHLLAQLQDRDIGPEIRELVEYLIYSMDDGGYLRYENVPIDPDSVKVNGEGKDTPHLEEIHKILGGEMDLPQASSPIREAFHVLQSLEPAGVGARNLRECLLLQMDRKGNFSSLARRIVKEDFNLLEKLKISVIAKKPGRLVGTGSESTVIPDLIVEEIEGQLVVMLNDRSVPSLKVSKAYANLLKKGSNASTTEKKFVREKLNSATWLIRAIEQRKSTMLKVMYAIIESQPDFFKKGPMHLKPLILQQIADKIGMHISTVSRVTNGKYVQTPYGIFELKYFFSAGVAQADGSEISAVSTKNEIKTLIKNEDPAKPLSDQKIVEMLKSKGFDVARRTVAKYRDQMEILPARLRKRY